MTRTELAARMSTGRKITGPRLTSEEPLLLDFARRQLSFDRALVAYNKSPDCDGPEATALDRAFKELREVRPKLVTVKL